MGNSLDLDPTEKVWSVVNDENSSSMIIIFSALREEFTIHNTINRSSLSVFII